ncbi:unnamed protein product [Litomosoides sigmodontis]|uniref:Neurotransmitter-gated ion-channel ligand-binding domain-containing protein n=1 Tax=Litomosoides sigmodontis TaxID=42156 RepID=A0A3P6TVZ3_LITSI|nr:unnamed protein product [Litomosoides sigmodontis]
MLKYLPFTVEVALSQIITIKQCGAVLLKLLSHKALMTIALLVTSNRLPTQLRLVRDMLETYDKKSKPVWDHNKPINVTFNMDLYQILEVNEPQQYVLLNAWIIERWYDEFLYWRPEDYDNITEIHLPHNSIWIPDTTLYNSLVMKDDETRRLINVKLTIDENIRAAHVCSMIFSSWTFDQTGIDYFAYSDTVGMTNYIENEGWFVLAVITIITFGTLASSVIIAIQKRGCQNSRLAPRTVCLVKFIACITLEDIPKHLTQTHKKQLKATSQNERRRSLLGTKEPKERWEQQWAFLQKRRKAQVVGSHTYEPPTLSYNNADLLSPKCGQSGRDITISPDIPDTVPTTVIPSMSSPSRQLHLAEDDIVSPKVIESDGDSIPIALDKSNSKSAQQQREPQNISGLRTEASVRQSRRLARDEYNWMAKVLERLFFIFFIIVFAFVTIGINSVGFYYWSSIDHTLYDSQ